MNPPKLVTLPKPDASENVVEYLEELLEMARAGDIHSIAAVVLYQNDDTQTRWVTGPRLLGALMHSAIAMLLRDWQDRMLEEREE